MRAGDAPFTGGRQRLSSSALPTTDTELAAMAAPAITGDSKPSAAKGMPKRIEEEREEQILPNLSKRRTRKIDGRRDRREVVAKQRHVGRGQRAACAGAHGERNIGLRQRRRVVDAVADHADDAPLFLQRDDRDALVVRQLFRAPIRRCPASLAIVAATAG